MRSRYCAPTLEQRQGEAFEHVPPRLARCTGEHDFTANRRSPRGPRRMALAGSDRTGPRRPISTPHRGPGGGRERRSPSGFRTRLTR
jgi:hypothetical protein